MKKILALVLAMLLVLGMTSAFAATVSIEGQTNGGVINGHTFKAYKVLAGNWEGGVLTNLTNGDGVSWSAEMLTALNAIEGISDVTDGKTLGAALDDKSAAVGEQVAKVLKNYTVDAKAITVTDGATLADGYYIVIDETTLGKDEVANAALLQVAGETVTIAVKTSTTTVDKKIDGDTDADTTTSGLVDANNGQVGDLVPYVITATIADTKYYDKYYFELNDTVSAGLDISATTGADAFSNYKVYDNDTEITTGYTLTVDPVNRTIQLKIDDAKAQGGHTIKLTYNAKINENAVVGVAGNPNTVELKYTNNPDHSGDGEYNTDTYTTTTPKQIVKTFVTGIELLKVDAQTKEALEGAVFSITGSRNLSTVVTEQGFVVDAEGTWYALNDGSYTEKVPGTDGAPTNYVDGTTKYKKATITTTKTQTSDVKVQGTTGADGKLKFNDLGEGTYTINEIKAPTGYNMLSAPIVFTIACAEPAEIVDGTETCTWTSKDLSGIDEVNFDADDGIFKITVENASGQQLPTTGGMGTTILYIGGSILVLAAVILLVTKRRMRVED